MDLHTLYLESITPKTMKKGIYFKPVEREIILEEATFLAGGSTRIGPECILKFQY